MKTEPGELEDVPKMRGSWFMRFAILTTILVFLASVLTIINQIVTICK